MENTYISRDGVKLYAYPNTRLHSFYLSLFVRAGTLLEDERTQGITHALEHVAIRNVHTLTGGTLYRTLDRLGLDFNASTYRDMVQFYISGSHAHFAEGADILCRLLSALVLPGSEVEAERRRIKAEIREADERRTLTGFTAACLYPDSPGRFSILGTKGTVSAMSRRTLEAYRTSVMCAENIFFYATGCVAEEDMRTLAETVDRYTLPHGTCRDNILPPPSAFMHRDAAVHVKRADYTAVRMSFDIDTSCVGSAECDLLYDALFTGYNARFFLELSEKRGLCYDITGGVDRYRNLGCFYFSFECAMRDLDEAVAASVELLSRCKHELMARDALPYAVYVENADMLLDDAAELNFTMAYETKLLGLPYTTLDDRKRAYAAITPERLREVCRTVFRPEACTLTVKGDPARIHAARLHETLLRLGE